MKKILIILIATVSSMYCTGQVNLTDTSNMVAFATLNKDTLYLANNEVGCLIEEAWEMSYVYKKPIIIFKPKWWIIKEYIKNKDEEDN
jgi:hypothetical protein